jgi:cerevisin
VLNDLTDALFRSDTGIYTEHQVFGGRARWGATFGGSVSQDIDGRGTGMASMAAGPWYSPATAANLVAVKVYDDPRHGRRVDVVAGIEWIVKNKQRPSIVVIGLTDDPTKGMTHAVGTAISRGIHFAGGAGNRNLNASTLFPGNSE